MTDDTNIEKTSRELTEQDKKIYALLLHLSGIANFVIPAIGGSIASYIIWKLTRDRNDYLKEEGRKVINFQITWSILFLISIVSVIGISIAPLLGIAFIVLMIFGALSAKDLKPHDYSFDKFKLYYEFIKK